MWLCKLYSLRWLLGCPALIRNVIFKLLLPSAKLTWRRALFSACTSDFGRTLECQCARFDCVRFPWPRDDCAKYGFLRSIARSCGEIHVAKTNAEPDATKGKHARGCWWRCCRGRMGVFEATMWNGCCNIFCRCRRPRRLLTLIPSLFHRSSCTYFMGIVIKNVSELCSKLKRCQRNGPEWRERMN